MLLQEKTHLGKDNLSRSVLQLVTLTKVTGFLREVGLLICLDIKRRYNRPQGLHTYKLCRSLKQTKWLFWTDEQSVDTLHYLIYHNWMQRRQTKQGFHYFNGFWHFTHYSKTCKLLLYLVYLKSPLPRIYSTKGCIWDKYINNNKYTQLDIKCVRLRLVIIVFLHGNNFVDIKFIG